MRHGALGLLTAALVAGTGGVGAATPTTAPSVRLSARLAPERLGRQTAVSTAFRIAPAPGRTLPPLVGLRLLYPAGLGLATSELGFQNCAPARLRARGAGGCPGNSLIGRGTATVQVAFADRAIGESAPVSIFSAPSAEGPPGLLFAVTGRAPVIAKLVFSGARVEAGGAFGGGMEATLPLVPTVPNGPYVTLSGLAITIGGPGIVYRERTGGRTIVFHPRGMLLPPRCPRGGFPFMAQLTFADGSRADTRTAVRCPAKQPRVAARSGITQHITRMGGER